MPEGGGGGGGGGGRALREMGTAMEQSSRKRSGMTSHSLHSHPPGSSCRYGMCPAGRGGNAGVRRAERVPSRTSDPHTNQQPLQEESDRICVRACMHACVRACVLGEGEGGKRTVQLLPGIPGRAHH